MLSTTCCCDAPYCVFAGAQVDSVPAGRLLWQLTWDQMLCVELAYHTQQRNAAPDGVIVHRKYRSEGDDVLVHDVRCTPNSNQVSSQASSHTRLCVPSISCVGACL